MKIALGFLISILFCTYASAQTYWTYYGSKFELEPDGDRRTLKYFEVRRDLPVRVGTTVFSGFANGSSYSGTAYNFLNYPRCRPIGYDVQGTINVARRSIILSGSMPVRDSQCRVVEYRENVLEFRFSGCSCACVHDDDLQRNAFPELTPFEIQLQREMEELQRRLGSRPEDSASCPYLYAWSQKNSTWHKYGKVIKDARGRGLERSDTIELLEFATKFRLSEEEPEHSYIDQIQLSVVLKKGSHIRLKPTNERLANRDGRRVYIPPFKSIDIAFRLPKTIKRADILKSSLQIIGYYESLPIPAPPMSTVPRMFKSSNICRPPKVASGS